jgi:hypothetical protein
MEQLLTQEQQQQGDADNETKENEGDETMQTGGETAEVKSKENIKEDRKRRK